MTSPGIQDLMLRRESELADLAELAGPLTHEINHLLNTLTLQMAVLEQTRSAELATDMATIRRQIRSAAERITQFQRYRQGNKQEPALVDLNVALHSVLKE